MMTRRDYPDTGEALYEKDADTMRVPASMTKVMTAYIIFEELEAGNLTLDTLVRLVNRLGVTVDYLLADSVTGSDEAVLDEFKQIVDNQPLERKLMALQVLRTIFAYFEKEGA